MNLKYSITLETTMGQRGGVLSFDDATAPGEFILSILGQHNVFKRLLCLPNGQAVFVGALQTSRENTPCLCRMRVSENQLAGYLFTTHGRIAIAGSAGVP